jgi:hypothetical protein
MTGDKNVNQSSERPKWTYEELEAFAKKYHDAGLVKQQADRGEVPLENYIKAQGDLYADDLVYTWGLGPYNPDFVANNKDEVMRICFGAESAGVEFWNYPWRDYWIDPEKGVVYWKWEMVTPWQKPDGTYYQAAGFIHTFARYAGDMKCDKLYDANECMALYYCHEECIAAGLAPEVLTKKYNLRTQRIALAKERRQEYLEELCEERDAGGRDS